MSCLHLWALGSERKNARHGQTFGFDPSLNLSSQFSAVTGLWSWSLYSGHCVSKSYATSVIKQHFYFGHQKTLHGSKLYITTCCVERMWRGLNSLWVLLGPSVEKQRLTQLFLLPHVCDCWLRRAFQVKSTSFMVPSVSWTVLKSWTFL